MPAEKRNVVRFELLMDAGFGAQKAGDILIRAFARMNKEVYIEPIIPAEISPPPRTRPALSGALIRVAKFNLTNIGNNTDVMLAAHEIVLDRRMDDEEYNPKAIVLLDICDKKSNEESYERVCKRVSQQGLSLHTFDITDQAKALIKSLNGKGKNMYYLGMLAKVYSVPEEVIINEIKMMFGAKLKPDILDKNIEIFHQGHAFAG